ncbi:hypothetical protein ACFRAQ_22425 [Nocardia sp. NPDC056611]|uniref:hypothetical protein n=1 Tax=Nocardia sp. NPDC056611 TaxID=3345877 RepID=UPI00366B967B
MPPPVRVSATRDPLSIPTPSLRQVTGPGAQPTAQVPAGGGGLDLPPLIRTAASEPNAPVAAEPATGPRPDPHGDRARRSQRQRQPEEVDLIAELPEGRRSPGAAVGEAGPAPVSGALPEAAESVVMRWNPHGLALLRGMLVPEPPAPPAVALIAADTSLAAALRVELARFQPRLDLIIAGAAADGGRVGDGMLSAGTDAPEVNGGDDARSRPYRVALVVLDAGALIGGELLGRVRGLRADGTRIVFALDGIHAHREWREVRKLDAELLEAAGAGGDEIVPVSGRMAAVGRVAGDAALVDRSGVGLLHARLVAAAGAGAVGDQMAIVRERVLEETRQRIRGQLGKVRDGGDVAGLREERARLLAVGDGGRGAAMSVVRNRAQLARVELLHEVGARIRGLHGELRDEIDGLARNALAEFPPRVGECVEKLTQEMDRSIRSRIGELCRQVEESVAAEWHISFPAPADRVSRAAPTPGPRLRGVEDHLVLVLGASAGFGLGRLLVTPLALLQAFDYAIMPISLVLGAAGAGWVVRARRRLAEGAHLRQWVADALVDARAGLEQRVATALVDAEERLTDEVLGSAAARMVETDLRVGELEAQLRHAAQRRPALVQACERDLVALEFV